MILFLDLRRLKFAILHDGTAGTASVNHQPQSAAQRSENCSKHEGAGPSVVSRILREPPTGTDCVSGQSSRSLGRRRCSAEHGTPRHCSVGHPSPARHSRRSMQTHARRVKQDGCSTDDIRPKRSLRSHWFVFRMDCLNVLATAEMSRESRFKPEPFLQALSHAQCRGYCLSSALDRGRNTLLVH
jgi:hypothetical protein